MDSFVRARSVLADDLPDVRGGLLTRYALLVFTAGTDVTEDLVRREWQAHHGQDRYDLNQRVAVHTLLIAETAEKLGRPGPKGWFVPGSTYCHPQKGLFDVRYVDVAPTWSAYADQVGAAAFGWRHVDDETLLAEGGGCGVSFWQKSTGPYWAADFEGWRLMQQTKLTSTCDAHG